MHTHSRDELRQILNAARTIAIVGLSDNPERPSYGVAQYLQFQGYTIIPVNPQHQVIMGLRSYPMLATIPEPVDVVDIFRRSDMAGVHVDEAIAIGAKLVWLQLGVRDDAAAQRAQGAGITFVQDRCLAVDHRLLVRG